MSAQSHHSNSVGQLILSLWIALTPVSVLAENQLEVPQSLRQSLELVSSQRMVEDVRTLSGPTFNGRQTGTSDDLASAEFVRQRFLESNSSQPSLPESRSEASSAHASIRIQSTSHRPTIIGKDSFLRLTGSVDSPPDQIGPDYLPVLDSPSADVQAPIVFVGYGISDPEGGFDEYAGLDVRQKVVLFLRGKPERYAKQVSHADKAHAAHAHGALAYLTATGPILTAYETRRGVTGRPSTFYGLTEPGRTIPGAWISTARAMAILHTDRSGSSRRAASSASRSDFLSMRPSGK